ncbi:MAG TPA: NAD(P)-dependent oxidoreductase [Miltoncostaeaceae bacterium]|nr:NAD(P)-dependent oxidoreductase [Miltoncostaeaceae bacterium]
MRIGFVGVGLMGAGMVRNLAAAGHEVTVYARTPARADGLPARSAPSVAAAVTGADVACTCVTDSDDVREVVAQVLTAPSPPPLMADFSTIAPAVAGELARTCADRGVGYADCPVSGGPPGAEAGTLAVMCGGDPDVVARLGPVLDAVGDPARRVHCGPPGAGLVAKLVNNLLVAVISAGTAEAFGIGQRAGLDPELLRRVVMASSGDSWQLRNLFPRVLAGDHRPGFRTRDLRKDLGHARAVAGGPLPLGDVAAELFAGVPGDQDYGAVARRFLHLPDGPGAT